MTDPQKARELDDLLSDQNIGFGRVRDMFEEYAIVCNLEKQILRDEPMGPALGVESSSGER